MDENFLEQLWSQRAYGTPLTIIFMVIPTAAVALRLYAKAVAHHAIELSDCFTLASWAITMGFFITMLVAVYMPASYLDNPDGIDEPVSKITFASNLLWTGACYCCKLSILCLYHRLLATPSYGIFRIIVIAMFVLTACIGVASCLGFLLIFKDLSWWWTTGLAAHPIDMANELKMNLAIDIMSLLTDVILFAMPLPVISRLKLDRGRKRLLIFLFSLGFLTCIEVMIRVIMTYGFNGAFDAIQVQILLMGIEPAMGITICSLPMFIRLFRKGTPSSSDNRYYASRSAGQGNFYLPSRQSNTKRSIQDPDGALLESIDMSPVGKPTPVYVHTDITIQTSHSSGHDSLGAKGVLWREDL